MDDVVLEPATGSCNWASQCGPDNMYSHIIANTDV
jgi:hypothetical protein